MWEFSSQNDADLGHAFSHISVVRMNNDRWAAILGNGYNDFDPTGSGEANGSGKAQLFILYLDKTGAWQAGVNYFKISTGVGDQTEAGRNGLSTPGVVDLDSDGDADRAYAGDLKGNLWVFDLSSDDSQEWGLANSGNPLFLAKNASNKLQPITAEPMVVKNPAVDDDDANQPNVLVLFGTGQYLVEGDKTNTDRQSFYGVADTGSLLRGVTLTRAKLVAQTVEGGYSDDIRVLTAKSVDYATQSGWFFDLPAAGERVITEAAVRGRSFFYSSLIPSTDPCEYGGSGWLMVADLENGGRPQVAEFDLNGDRKVDGKDSVAGPPGQDGKPTQVAVSGSKYNYGCPPVPVSRKDSATRRAPRLRGRHHASQHGEIVRGRAVVLGTVVRVIRGGAGCPWVGVRGMLQGDESMIEKGVSSCLSPANWSIPCAPSRPRRASPCNCGSPVRCRGHWHGESTA